MNAVELYENKDGELALCWTGGEYDLFITGNIGNKGNFRTEAEILLTDGVYLPGDIKIAVLPREILDGEYVAKLEGVCDTQGYSGLISYREIDRAYTMVARYTLGHMDVYGVPRTVIRALPGSSARSYLGADAPEAEV